MSAEILTSTLLPGAGLLPKGADGPSVADTAPASTRLPEAPENGFLALLLALDGGHAGIQGLVPGSSGAGRDRVLFGPAGAPGASVDRGLPQIGRASCRERV